MISGKIIKLLKNAVTVMVTAFLFAGQASAQANISVHDPVMIQQDSMYYLFCTGRGITEWSSKDMKTWKREKPVFDTLPWAVKEILGFKNHIWAPDISHYNGLYYLFYSISTFGKNNSAIGLATNKTLHITDSNYKWVDHGMIIRSYATKDRFNCIDPNLIADIKGNPWLAFGSFWSGVKIVPLQKDGMAVLPGNKEITGIAGRNKKDTEQVVDTAAGNGAIEAPFIYKRDKYYYLFVSFDYCCRAEKSDYKMAVGRSKNIMGPYLDKDGNNMMKGGGTIILQGNKDWYGVGHNAVCSFNGKEYLVFHGYDAKDKGRSKLLIKEIGWDKQGWPMASW